LPWKERPRDKHRHQGGGRRDHREEYLLRAEDCGSAAAQSHGTMASYVLKDHNRIVDHQPSCQHERQQRQDVD
jgi:hypothetical protein